MNSWNETRHTTAIFVPEIVEQPQPLYIVRFAARELWGAEAPTEDAVYIELFEDDLEPGGE